MDMWLIQWINQLIGSATLTLRGWLLSRDMCWGAGMGAADMLPCHPPNTSEKSTPQAKPDSHPLRHPHPPRPSKEDHAAPVPPHPGIKLDPPSQQGLHCFLNTAFLFLNYDSVTNEMKKQKEQTWFFLADINIFFSNMHHHLGTLKFYENL